MVSIFAGRVVRGERPTVFGDGRQTRDYVYVGDVVRAFVAAADADRAGRWNVGTGREVSVIDLIDGLGAISGAAIEPEFAPARQGELQASALDPAALQRDLGVTAAMPLGDGLRAVYEWVRAGRARSRHAVGVRRAVLAAARGRPRHRAAGRARRPRPAQCGDRRDRRRSGVRAHRRRRAGAPVRVPAPHPAALVAATGLAFYALLALASEDWSLSPLASRQDALRATSYALAVLLGAAIAAQGERPVRSVLTLIGGLAVAECAWAVVARSFATTTIGLTGRLQGTLGNANSLAMLGTVAAIAGLALAARSPRLGTAVASLGTFTAFATSSRAAAAAAIVAAVVLALATDDRPAAPAGAGRLAGAGDRPRHLGVDVRRVRRGGRARWRPRAGACWPARCSRCSPRRSHCG